MIIFTINISINSTLRVKSSCNIVQSEHIVSTLLPVVSYDNKSSCNIVQSEHIVSTSTNSTLNLHIK